MIRNTIGALALALVLVVGLATAGVLFAQRSGGMGMMSMMENCPMVAAMQQSPRAALEHREELELTDDQIRQLEVLQEGKHQAQARPMEQMQTLHYTTAELMKKETFDEAAVRAAFEHMGDLHTQMGVAMLRTRHATRQVLTAEQRDELAELGGGMMGMHGMMRTMEGMDMENCPMMKSGMMVGMQMQGSGMHDEHHPQN